jgi:PIN domain nuclease of toxin-antitoxin system
MTTLLDAYCVVALLAGEPAGGTVQAMLREAPCEIPAVNLAEAADVLERVYSIPETDVRRVVEPIEALMVRPVDARIAWRAAFLRSKYYARRTSELSLADCILLASARPEEDAIATADPPVAIVARAEGIRVVGVPDSSGRLP